MTDQTLILGDSLEMTAAGPLHKELLGRRGQPVTLDASQVRRIGGQCLQVLLSAQTTWAADGAAFEITDPSTEFTDGLALMGASHLAPTLALSLVQD
ncbi:MAG: STAS domain-containing protein [Alphaproteobacteria bacterium]|nr:STAS domain-containing protein [Alphaproteobacteria bacterium]MBU1515845.1 STAS domain-containing protein [Alphaproteobacteria bacterium]MBU2094067.1 STAS domain-containing protein [Alphaproteobacteria bacterium]MBU2151419.1 STAS domain-containing protein [Alphaproteobacteria bacterium]MBU2305305.1 STAS domain-containing protein [Alphaproteobacteria bacterium]